jgi:hypothetical protein
MEINQLEDLDKLELKIRQKISKFRLGDVLYSLYGTKDRLPPFITAGIALFAVRFSPPSLVTQNLRLVNIQPIIKLVSDYLLADPITFDKEIHDNFINSNPVFLILRVVCSQFPFDVSRFSQFSRPMLLYYDIPNSLAGQKGIPNFELQQEFENLNGVSIPEFISIGFAASAFASNNFTFSLNLFEQVRSRGINLPDNKVISQVINQLSGTQIKLNNLYIQRKISDRRFRMYDFNPLREHPLILPCRGRGFVKSGQDFICAPVPTLIDERISIGIYYQLFNNFKQKFADYFGYILEEYLKIVLNNSITSEVFVDIRNLSINNNIKSPDYAIIDGSIALIFECKATKFNLPAQTIASEEAVNDSLKQVKKGLIQLDTFIKACKSKLPGLHQFHHCTIFKPILVSLEPLYLINSVDFRNHVNELLKNESIVNLDWRIFSIGELEVLQPHLVQGINLSQVIQNLENNTFNDVFKQLCSKTNKSYKDSFLYPKQEELYQRLGIPDRSE